VMYAVLPSKRFEVAIVAISFVAFDDTGCSGCAC
jgi:hypothetical protein